MRQFTAEAPARANIIGEHTDYATNGGHVLPTPLPFTTTVTVKEIDGKAGTVTLTSASYPGEAFTRTIDEPAAANWTDYVLGSVRAVAKLAGLPPLKAEVSSRVPVGSGISSSAALCVGTVRALNGLLGLGLDDVRVALMAHEAEHDYVGVPCGKMDQFASSVGRPGKALLLNTRTLGWRLYPLPPGFALMLVDCGTKHDLAKGGGYKQRVAECREARDRLGVATLCELGYYDLPRLSLLPDVVARRARHVITENLRVLEYVDALEKADTEKQAELIAASHISQRDDFQCSIPETDALVESSWRFGVRGARIVGGGFGGAIIALVPDDRTDAWWRFVSKENPSSRLISTYALHDRKSIKEPQRR